MSPEQFPRVGWERGADASRAWAITRQQPVASLLAGGHSVGFTRKLRPPAALMRRELIIHAGTVPVPYNRVPPSCRAAAEEALGCTLEEARRELPMGRVVGRARLIAAMQIAGLEHGRGTEPDRLRCVIGRRAHHQMGVWQEFDRCERPPGCDVSPGRWLWCFEAPVGLAGEAVKGFGGLWDFELGKGLRAAQAERDAA